MRLIRFPRLSSTSQTVALASVLSFGAQVLFALLMLRWFTPQEVGEFSVISQIAFFWMTLALAQAPLSLLANQTHAPHQEAQQHWRSSVLRWCAMAPLALLAWWVSQLHLVSALWWVTLIALCQLSWGLAQSFVLRTGSRLQQLAVRVVPPLCSVLVAWLGSQLANLYEWQAPTLVLSALLGYFVGSLWLLPVWLKRNAYLDSATSNASSLTASHTPHAFAVQQEAPTATPLQTDNRSTFLRLTHTFFDVLLATAIIVVWQRLYGPEETGWLSALLRVFGFVPAVIHMAWAQVKLTQTHQTDPTDQHAFTMGLLGCASLIGIGLSALLALHMQWLDVQWQGLASYLWPLVLWQGSACLSASVSHRPFQTGSATQYSRNCIGIAVLQLVVLLAPAVVAFDMSPIAHLIGFTALSSMALLGLAKWSSTLR